MGFGRSALWRLDAEDTFEKMELLLRREAEWSEQSGVTRIIGAEKKIEASLPLDPPLRLTATIDRLEEGEDRVVIVDYKSGKAISRSDLEKGERVQLQLYGYAGRGETRAGRVIARYAWLDPQAREWDIDSSRAEDALAAGPCRGGRPGGSRGRRLGRFQSQPPGALSELLLLPPRLPGERVQPMEMGLTPEQDRIVAERGS